jgi:protein ImuA
MQSKQCHHVRIEALRQKIAHLEGMTWPPEAPPVKSGCSALDQSLPDRGFRRGTLVEWLSGGEGAGTVTLALLVARQACLQGGALVVLDRSREFYPPAAARLGIDLARLIVVQPAGQADHHWALDQSLRCPAVAAALAWPDAMGETLDSRTFRRLQLAAEEGGGLGLLVRPESVRQQPSWADVRLLVEPLPPVPGKGEEGRGKREERRGGRRLKILLLRCRGGTDGRSAELEIDP